MTSGCVDAVPQEPSVHQFRACSARLCTPIRHKLLPQLEEARFPQTQTGARRAVESGRWTQKRFLPTSELCKRSEEHTSELQSRLHLVCRLLLEKKKI